MTNSTTPLATTSTAAEVLRALRRYWFMALLVAGLSAAAAGGLADRSTPKAKATASILVEDPRAAGIFEQSTTDATYVANQVAVLELPSMVRAAHDLMVSQGVRSFSITELADEISISNTDGNDLIELSLRDPSPELAQIAVNAYVQAYTDSLVDAATRDRARLVARLDEALRGLDTQLRTTPSSSASGLRVTYDDLLRRKAEAIAIDPATDAGVATISPASLPALPDRPSPAVWALAGAAVGVIPAGLLSFLIAHARRRFNDRFEPETVMGVPLLTDIPDFRAERLQSDVPVLDAPASASAEAFRFGSTLVAVRQAERGSRVHAVVSASSQDGKSTVSANLAVTSAQAGRRVLVVDGDLAGRGLSFLLLHGQTEGPGLVDVLEGRISLAAAVVTLRLPGGATLDVLRGGSDSADAGRLLSSSRSQELLDALHGDYDEVLLDVPPVLQVAYAAALVRAADAVVAVIPHHATVARVEALVERLDVLEASVLGYLYNVAPLRRELGVHSRLVSDVRRRASRGSGDEALASPAATANAPVHATQPGGYDRLAEQRGPETATAPEQDTDPGIQHNHTALPAPVTPLHGIATPVPTTALSHANDQSPRAGDPWAPLPTPVETPNGSEPPAPSAAQPQSAPGTDVGPMGAAGVPAGDVSRPT